MPYPRFPMLMTRSALALVVTLAVGACGDRGSGRPQGTGGKAAPDTSVEQAADTAAMPAAGADTMRGAAAVNPPDTTSSARAVSPARGNATGRGNAEATPETSAVDTAAATAAAAAAALDSAHPFMPVTVTLEVPPAPIRPRVLRDVRAGRHPGFERVVFEMAGDTLPGYRITYVNPPVIACGSGRHVSLAGKAVLVVRLDPAKAHDEAGHATIADRRQKPGFPVLEEMALTCDFEGQVQWALGLDRQAPFRVLKLQHPARLVLDLQEGS